MIADPAVVCPCCGGPVEAFRPLCPACTRFVEALRGAGGEVLRPHNEKGPCPTTDRCG